MSTTRFFSKEYGILSKRLTAALLTLIITACGGAENDPLLNSDITPEPVPTISPSPSPTATPYSPPSPSPIPDASPSPDQGSAIGALRDVDPNPNALIETAPIGSIAQIQAYASDPDGDEVRYSLLNNDKNLFQIDTQSGLVTLAMPGLNYSLQTSHRITVSASSSDGSSSQRVFVIYVLASEANNENEPIGSISDSNPASNRISENAGPGVDVNVQALAIDTNGDTVTYTLSDDADGRFTINPLTGVVSSASDQFNYEETAYHNITINAQSEDGSSSHLVVQVAVVDEQGNDTDNSVTDLHDAAPTANTISEQASAGSPVFITALASDADGDPVQYSLSDDADGLFSIDTISGDVTLAESNLNYEHQQEHQITVVATSGDGSTSSARFTIEVREASGPSDTDLTGYNEMERNYVVGREFGNIGYFENTVSDNDPTLLYAEDDFNDLVNDTGRVRSALSRASRETNGGVVRLLPAQNSVNTRFSLAHIPLPSNIRIEIHPDVVLEMRGIKEGTTAEERTKLNRTTLFSIGRSNGPKNLLSKRVENVEIRSTHPTRRFTVDSRSNMPHYYGYQPGANGANGIVNLTRAIAVSVFYARNFRVADMTILDNHTESVAIQMAADSDYGDGAHAWRFGSAPVFLENAYIKAPTGQPNNPMYSDGDKNIRLPMDDAGNFIDDSGNTIPDMFAIRRNTTYGRTPIKGSIQNIKTRFSHTGYGAVQIYGGDWIEIDQIDAFNGIGVRIEAGNGSNRDNPNRSGPYYTAANKIRISNVKVANGFTGVWLKAHSKIHKDIQVHNVEAIDSASAILVGKGAFGCGMACRDLTRGRINELEITGDIILRQTKFDHPVAEVGNLATYLITDFNRHYIARREGKRVDQLNSGDLLEKQPPRPPTQAEIDAMNLRSSDFDVASGTRWYKIFPIAPVLALAQYAENDIGDQSSKIGYFPVDVSQANLAIDGVRCDRDGNLCTREVLYRSDMRHPDGSVAEAFINK